MNEGEIKQEIRKVIESYRNGDEKRNQIIDEILLSNLEKQSGEEFFDFLKKGMILDENGSLNLYILDRFIKMRLENINERNAYQERYGEDPFEKKNKIVILEKTLDESPIEFHVSNPLPDELKNKEQTRLTTTGMYIVQLSFCDALLKLQNEWENREELKQSDQLKLVSFLINKGTANFLSEIGFDVNSVKLIPTEDKNPPKIDSKDCPPEVEEELKSYIDRYAIHSAGDGSKKITKRMGIGKLTKNDLLNNPEVFQSIIKKMQELKIKLENKGINMQELYEKYQISDIPLLERTTENPKNLVLLEEYKTMRIRREETEKSVFILEKTVEEREGIKDVSHLKNE